jgi:gamma-glutamyltranspeptidase/glutathione hydrolase
MPTERRKLLIDIARATRWSGGLQAAEGQDTTHLTVADGKGNVVSTTQTINSLFGARFIVPGTGMIPNNYMNNYRPAPRQRAVDRAGQAGDHLDVADDGAAGRARCAIALGLPGGRKIFPSALQALVNLIDHGMRPAGSRRGAAPLDRGPVLEVEHGIPAAVRQAQLAARGHTLKIMPTVAGGMNAIQFHDDGTMTGAACWRADGTAAALGGGLARAGVRFVLPN